MAAKSKRPPRGRPLRVDRISGRDYSAASSGLEALCSFAPSAWESRPAATARSRFITAPVPAGSRVRLEQTLVSLEPVDGNGHRLTMASTVEVEGSTRPALVAEVLTVIYD